MFINRQFDSLQPKQSDSKANISISVFGVLYSECERPPPHQHFTMSPKLLTAGLIKIHTVDVSMMDAEFWCSLCEMLLAST